MSARLALALLALILLSPLAACGKKGPLEPPADQPNTYPRVYPRE
jgi:predicted small lipoprotein YifL